MTEQAKVKNWGIDIEFNLGDEIKLDFTGYLSKPKKQGQRATFDSFNEFMRSSAFDFVESNPLYVIREKEVNDGDGPKIIENRIELTGSHLYNSCMQMIMDSLDGMNERGDPMFVVKIDDKKLKRARNARKDYINRIARIQEEVRDLDLELAKIQAVKEAKEQILGQHYQSPIQSPQAPMIQEPIQRSAPTRPQTLPKKKRITGRNAEIEMDVNDVKNLF